MDLDKKMSEAPDQHPLDAATFIKLWQHFQLSRGLDARVPTSKPVFSLPDLFAEVQAHGGSNAVSQKKLWTAIGGIMLPSEKHRTNLGYIIKQKFMTHLYDFEDASINGDVDLQGLGFGSPPERPASDAHGATKGPAQNNRSSKRKAQETWLDPAALLSERIGIYSEATEEYEFGTIQDYHPSTDQHSILFEKDNKKKEVDLNKAVWVLMSPGSNLLGEGPPVVGQASARRNSRRKGGLPPRDDDAHMGPQQMQHDSDFSQQHPAAPQPQYTEIQYMQLEATQQAAGDGDGGKGAVPYRVYKTTSGPAGYEIFLPLPGYASDEVAVRAYPDGRVVVKGDPKPRKKGRGRPPAHAKKVTMNAAPFIHTVQLPGRIDLTSIQALFGEQGQRLYIWLTAA